MDEEMILPDDFQEAPPQAEPQAETTTEVTEVEETKPTEVAQEPTKLKVKYNHEEKEITLEEARELAQKGLNYDKTVERLKSLETAPELQFVKELAEENGMTIPEYLQAVKAQKEQQKLDELVQQNIPEELAKEILETKKFRQQMEAEKKAKEADEKLAKEYEDFQSQFKGVKLEDIPPEVWKINAQGIPLKYAYLEHEANNLKNQVQILKQNQANKTKAPVGPVSLHGSQEVAEEDPFLQGFNSY